MSFLYKCAISLDLFAYRWQHNESVPRWIYGQSQVCRLLSQHQIVPATCKWCDVLGVAMETAISPFLGTLLQKCLMHTTAGLKTAIYQCPSMDEVRMSLQMWRWQCLHRPRDKVRSCLQLQRWRWPYDRMKSCLHRWHWWHCRHMINGVQRDITKVLSPASFICAMSEARRVWHEIVERWRHLAFLLQAINFAR